MSKKVYLKGRYRSYIPSTAYNDNCVGATSIIDSLIAVLIALFFVLFQLTKVSGELGTSVQEKEILGSIDHYLSHEFYLDSRPPLSVQLFSLLTFVYGELSVELLRAATTSCGGIALVLLYLGLRKSSVNRVISVIAVVSFSYLRVFREETLRVSTDIFQVCFLAMSLYSWKSFKVTKPFSKTWYKYLLLLSISLGLSISNKFVGFMTWSWILSLSIVQLWNIIADVRLTGKQVFTHFALRFMALVLVPTIIFLLSYYAHISTLTQDLTDFSTFMSPYYKHTLENNPLNEIVPPGRVYYGSTITIRHKDSLGGYLHSHELNYQSGSHEQQVTLYDFPDNNNEWIVEHKNENKDVSSKAVAVKNGENIRLRHRLTGKLLRASGAKPPVSEQDYDREVSCTGDANYTGQSDELWKIRFSGRLLEGLVPLDTTFQLTNQGQGCTLLSHDLRLPEWALFQQEVLCLDPPTKERTLFYVESSNRYSEDHHYIFVEDNSVVKFLKLLKEYLYKQFKYDYYIKNYKAEGDVGVGKWPWYISGDYLDTVIWFSAVFSILAYLLLQTIRLITWNPWNVADVESPLSYLLYIDNGLEFSVGWLLHYYIFFSSRHSRLFLFQYLPSLLLGLCHVATSAQAAWCQNNLTRYALVVSAVTIFGFSFK